MDNEQVVVFIDGTNLSKGLKECYGIERLDILAYSKFLAKGRTLRGIYYAEAPYLQERGINSYRNQMIYLAHIRKIKGLVYRKGYYSKWTTPPTEKMTDVNLAVDMVDLCHRNECDTAFIISGDADLCPAIDVLVREGKKVIIVYFDNAKRNAYALRKHAGGLFMNITRTVAEKFKWEPPKKEPEPEGSGGTMSKMT